MPSRVSSMGLQGIDGYEITVECFITNGLPGFDIVGLPDVSVKEARERFRAAIKNCGFKFPASRITLNLAPAGTKKTGTLYDLPILLGILSANGTLRLPNERCAFLGELSLEGKIRGVRGVLPMALEARACGIQTLYVPQENALEAIRYANDELGFNGSVYSKMMQTNALMGRQTEETAKYRVSWTYHPSDGLEVTYEKK